MQTAIVKYQIGSHGGKLNVLIDENDPDGVVLAKANVQLRQEAGADLPMESVKFTILQRINKT
jgi:hypothetical protein